MLSFVYLLLDPTFYSQTVADILCLVIEWHEKNELLKRSKII